MNPDCAAGRLKCREKAKDADRVETVEHLRLLVYLETSCHFCSLALHVVIAVVGPVGQTLTAVGQSCLVLCVSKHNEVWGLFRGMETSVAWRVNLNEECNCFCSLRNCQNPFLMSNNVQAILTSGSDCGGMSYSGDEVYDRALHATWSLTVDSGTLMDWLASAL